MCVKLLLCEGGAGFFMVNFSMYTHRNESRPSFSHTKKTQSTTKKPSPPTYILRTHTENPPKSHNFSQTSLPTTHTNNKILTLRNKESPTTSFSFHTSHYISRFLHHHTKTQKHDNVEIGRKELESVRNERR